MARRLTAREVIRRIETLGGHCIRTRGSHATYEVVRVSAQGEAVMKARAQVPTHSGDMAPGTLRAIERQLEAVLGKGWLLR